MKRLSFLFLLLLVCFTLVGCEFLNNGSNTQETENEQQAELEKQETYQIYRLAASAGYEGTYEEWLRSIKGEKGDAGLGIASISKTGTEGLVDTYTVTYTDGSKTTFTITNGNDGIGIVSIQKTKTEGLVDTYLITYTNGSTYEFTINNGDQGSQGIQGLQGKTGESAYELYKKVHSDYTKSEEEWLDDLVNGRLATVETIKHSVTFNSNGGSEVAPQEVEDLHNVNKPNDPTRDGYVFDGWYVDDEKWVFSGYIVTKDITLVAKWIAIEYQVTFVNDDNSVLYEISPVYYGDTLEYKGLTPEKVEKEDHYVYTFSGWDKELVVTGNMTITAQYTSEYAAYEEKYLDEEGNVIFSRLLTSDNSIELTFNDKIVEEVDGQLHLEAEDGVVSSGIAKQESLEASGWGKLGYIQVDGYVTFDFDLNNKMTALITIAVSNTSNSINSLINLTINGEDYVIDDDVYAPGTNTWDDFQEATIGKVHLQAGHNNITVTFKYDYFNMDYIGLIDCGFDLSQEGVDLPAKASDDDFMYQFHNWELQSNENDVYIYAPHFECATKGLGFSKGQVTQYYGTDEHIIIPSYWDGYEITSIGYAVFKDKEITSIELPDTLTSIGNAAFKNTRLTSVIIPDSVTNIDDEAFAKCDYLKNVLLGKSVKRIGWATFDWNRALENINLPDGLEEINTFAFSNCTALKSLTLPSSLKTIVAEAFIYCTGLKTLVVPTSITNMGSNVFNGCPDLIVLINGTVPSNWASNWAGNATVLVGYDSIVEENGYKYIIYAINGETKAMLFEISDDCTDLVIKDKTNSGISVQRTSSFAGNTKLKTVSLPSFLKQIPENMFNGCTSLTSVTIPSSIKLIGNNAFYNCTSLSKINSDEQGTFNIPNGVERIGENAFYGCRSLEYLYLPDSVTEIGVCSFDRCSSLKLLRLSESLTTIPEHAFEYCAIRYIKFPASIKKIGYEAFYQNRYLTSVVLPSTIEEIENMAFYETYTFSAFISSEIKKAGFCIFNAGCLTVYTDAEAFVPEWSEALSENGMKFNYTEFIFGDDFIYYLDSNNKMHIVQCIVYDRDNVTIPENVVEIKPAAFLNCSNIKTIIYAGSSEAWNNIVIGSDNENLNSAEKLIG